MRALHRRIPFGNPVLFSASLMSAAVMAGGGAQATTTPAKLKVKAPKSPITSGTHYDIGASGYSASFNRVALFVSVNKPCASTALAEARTSTPEHLFIVKTDQKFSVATKNTYTAKAPGDRYACAYLFLHNHSDATDQIRKKKHFTVIAKH